MMITDFHIHSNFSDGKHSIPEIVDYYGNRGFGAIAITDHVCETTTFLGKAAAYLDHTLTAQTFPLYQEILKQEAERAWDQYRMVVIPGVELTKNSISNHRSAHVLALGIHQFLPADGSIESLLKTIREQGGLSIAAHPVFTQKFEKQALHLWDRKEELVGLFDAWEVASGPYLFPEVQAAGIPMIANSDLHRFSQMTSWKTLMKKSSNPEEILEQIKKQKIQNHFYTDQVANKSNQHRSPSVVVNMGWPKTA